MTITTTHEPLAPNPNHLRRLSAMEFLLRQSQLPLEDQLTNCYDEIELHGTPTFWGPSFTNPDVYYRQTSVSGQTRVFFLLRRERQPLLAVFEGAGTQWSRRLLTGDEHEMLLLLPRSFFVRFAELKQASAKQLEVVRKLLDLDGSYAFPGPLLGRSISRAMECIVLERRLDELRADALRHATESLKEVAA